MSTATLPPRTSKLADLRGVRLADLPDLGPDILEQAASGVMPDPQAVLVPVAAFQSAI